MPCHLGVLTTWCPAIGPAQAAIAWGGANWEAGRDRMCLSSASGTIPESRLSLWNKGTFVPEFRARILSHERL